MGVILYILPSGVIFLCECQNMQDNRKAKIDYYNMALNCNISYSTSNYAHSTKGESI